MIRSFYALTALVLVAAAVSSCNTPTCGPGTVQKQALNGDTQCVPVDQPASLTPCDRFNADLGTGTADDKGGLCVSHIVCDPGTTMYDPNTGVCVGTGGGITHCAACPSPIPAGKVCVTGGLVDFEANMHVMGGASNRPVKIAIYEPLAFLNNPNTTPLDKVDSTTDACFTFTVSVPASGLVALAVTDPVGAAPTQPLAIGGSGATVVSGTKYSVDAYMVLKSTLDTYIAANAGFNMGAYTACYYNQAPKAPTDLLFTETMPATGVKILENGVTPAAARYLKLDGTADTTLMATGPRGCAITPGTNGVNQYSGTAGGVTKWETQPGGTAPNVVFVARYHSCDGQPMTGTCQ